LTTIVVKGKSSPSNSLFPNLSKHTCLIVKESKRKVKTQTPSSSKYASSGEDTLSSDDDDEYLTNELCKNPTTRIKGLMK
jgi:hypothetical protein